MTPEFHELVGEEGSQEELERLRRTHDLLVAAGPPAELSPQLAEPPAVRGGSPHVSVLPRRRRQAALLVAAALVAVAFGIGYLVGNRGNEAPTSGLVTMHGVGRFADASASVRIGEKDDYGNWPIVFKIRGLKKLPKGSWYELYLTAGGKLRVSCGSFNADGSATTMHFSVPYTLSAYNGWVVTAHRPGQPRSDKRVLLTT